MPGTAFTVEINPQIPAKLARLNDLANDLWYGWDRPTRQLFSMLDPLLWEETGHNPKLFLRRVNEKTLLDAAADRVFLENFHRVLSAYDTYMSSPVEEGDLSHFDETDLIAYFCAEFGLHESLPIYSGGLGILAGDHCKAASDLGLPFVAVGLLYRQGYFSQSIDANGHQIASYTDSDFNDLPVSPALKPDGGEILVSVDMPGRTVTIRVWLARVGHIRLFLLDTDLPANGEEDRHITHRLYGGDIHTRIKQEIVLGIGGVRALREAGLQPSVWHVNEGHAAFMILERMREYIAQGHDFDAALEAVAAATVFTTHTPVPAGHDIFSRDMMLDYFQPLISELGALPEKFLHLGMKGGDAAGFNQTALAIRGSRFQNGVSRIHGRVSAILSADMWPQLEPESNPISHVTNGVHVPTFLALPWMHLFDSFLGGAWKNKLSDVAFWERVEQIPDHLYWSVRQTLKSEMLHEVRERLFRQYQRNGLSTAQIQRLLRYLNPLDPNILTIGFARRFATYKRATLLFKDPARLRALLNNSDRPIVFIFAGKAHPADHPGQELIRAISQWGRQPDFEGRVHMVEGYDMELARFLLSGVDVWLNNPEYPMEASGTSGQKAGLNGVINLSVLDGWWGEGYDGDNGWAIQPVEDAEHEEANALYELLEEQVLPLYYRQGKHGYSADWVGKSKNAMKTILPRFNSARMVCEYANRFYRPATQHGKRLTGHNFQGAKTLSEWKRKVRAAWPGVGMRRLDQVPLRLQYGERLTLALAIDLQGLEPRDVRVELLFQHQGESRSYFFQALKAGGDSSGQRFRLEFEPDLCGRIDYQVRVYPYHELLAHPYEMGLMLWL